MDPGIRRVFHYLWDSEPTNVDDRPIILLGRSYDSRTTANDNGEHADTTTLSSNGSSGTNTVSVSKVDWPEPFLEDVETRIWLSYRTGFEAIPKGKNSPSSFRLGSILRGSGIDLNGYTTDAGWGCMIRTSQSLLANCLLLKEKGPEFRGSENTTSIVALFEDTPSAPFSIHKFVNHGNLYCDKSPGEWFGPSAAASSIKALTSQFAKETAEESDIKPSSRPLRTYVSDGSDIYESRLYTDLHMNQLDPTLILLGLRLGIDSINPVYWEALKRFLSYPQSVGIAGGRPSASHYFYGFQGDSLFYLDPHQPKPAMLCSNENFMESVHTRRIRTLHLKEMDPSMLVGFYVRDHDDWQDLKARLMSDDFTHAVMISRHEPSLQRRSSLVGGDDGFVDVNVEDDFAVDDSDDEAATLAKDQEAADAFLMSDEDEIVGDCNHHDFEGSIDESGNTAVSDSTNDLIGAPVVIETPSKDEDADSAFGGEEEEGNYPMIVSVEPVHDSFVGVDAIPVKSNLTRFEDGWDECDVKQQRTQTA